MCVGPVPVFFFCFLKSPGFLKIPFEFGIANLKTKFRVRSVTQWTCHRPLTKEFCLLCLYRNYWYARVNITVIQHKNIVKRLDIGVVHLVIKTINLRSKVGFRELVRIIVEVPFGLLEFYNFSKFLTILAKYFPSYSDRLSGLVFSLYQMIWTYPCLLKNRFFGQKYGFCKKLFMWSGMRMSVFFFIKK